MHGVLEREVVEHAPIDEERHIDGRAGELVRAAELRREALPRLLVLDVRDPAPRPWTGVRLREEGHLVRNLIANDRQGEAEHAGD